jgi:hypothetical protein
MKGVLKEPTEEVKDLKLKEVKALQIGGWENDM